MDGERWAKSQQHDPGCDGTADDQEVKASALRTVPWSRWGKAAFAVVVLQGLGQQLIAGPGSEQPLRFITLWLFALLYLGFALLERWQSRLAVPHLLWLENALAAALPWLGGGYLATAILPAIGLNGILLSWRWLLLLSAIHTANVLAVCYQTSPPALFTQAAYVLVVSVVFVSAFSRAVENELRLRVELAGALRQLAVQGAQAEAYAVAAERERIAREVHDSVGHALVTAHLHLRLAERDLQSKRDSAAQAISLARDVLTTGLSELRSTVRALDAPAAFPADLGQALAQLLHTYQRAGLRAEFEQRGPSRRLPEQITLALYRVVQEALTNVVKHAGAQQVRVRLHFAPQQLQLVIFDDGRGLDPTQEGFGLRGMRARIEALGGSWQAGPQDGMPGELQDGARLCAEIPYPPQVTRVDDQVVTNSA